MLRQKLKMTTSNENNNKKSRLSGNEQQEGQQDDLLDLSITNCRPCEKSKYFPSLNTNETALQLRILDLQNLLNSKLRHLSFSAPVEYVYNPLEYASKCNEMYVTKYCRGPKKIVFVGMNPGPFGMCQTGIPFGEINAVKNWLLINEVVEKPAIECPDRLILGFNTTRSEISGDRFWNLFRKVCGRVENFFTNAFVYNYCPLAFMKKNGCNVTPSELKNCKLLEEICDQTYSDIIRLLNPEVIVGIGRYAEKRTNTVLKNNNIPNIRVICMPHPSPRALNNQNWPEKAELFLKEQDLLKYFKI